MRHRHPLPQRTAALASVGLMLLFMAYLGATLRTGLGLVLDVVIGLVVGVLAVAVLTALLWAVLQILRPIGLRPTLYHAAILGASITFVGFLYGFEVPLHIALPIGGGLMLAQVGLGTGVGLWRAGKGRRELGPALSLLGLALDCAIAILLITPGSDRHLLRLDLPPVEALRAPNPVVNGPFPVRTLFYGSGTDLHRPEFGADVDLRTLSVDVRPFVQLGRFAATVREAHWGFGLAEFPINGRVWYPVGEGPFPLVLIVHGQDFMTEPADRGYAYLGQLFASHGLIAVSVDETFFNAYSVARMRQENDARGVLLLEHIRQWQGWNQAEGNPFHGQVDLRRIAIIGHSRGGEAAAIAAAFAQLEAYPDDPTIRFDYDFRINTVIGIAPWYGQYRPAGQDLHLQDVHYLLLQGSHDADVYANRGIRMYNRVSTSRRTGTIKAALYVYRANHSQFNTAWGRRDGNLPARWLLNQKPLLQPEEQRQVAQVYTMAFLKYTLLDDATYLPIFADPRLASEWLPDTLYAGRYSDSASQAIATYEEDDDPGTGSQKGSVLSGQGMTWEEGEVKFRYGGSQQNRAVSIAWEGSSAHYTLMLAPILAQEDGAAAPAVLAFDIADRIPYDPSHGLLDWTIELTDATGATARQALGQYAAVMPPLPVQFTRWGPWEREFGAPTEAVFQTVEIPLAEFGEIDPAQLTTIRFLFDRTSSGTVLLDEFRLR